MFSHLFHYDEKEQSTTPPVGSLLVTIVPLQPCTVRSIQSRNAEDGIEYSVVYCVLRRNVRRLSYLDRPATGYSFAWPWRGRTGRTPSVQGQSCQCCCEALGA